MESVIAFGVGVVIGAGVFLVWLVHHNKREIKAMLVDRHRLPKGVRRGQRPDVRRIVLRPVNKDEPPSRITQALIRQRPTRKLREDEPRDID